MVHDAPRWSTEVLTVGPETTLRHTAWLMTQQHVGSAVVVEDGNLIGIVTDRDLALEALRRELDPDNSPVRECMSSPVVTHAAGEGLRAAADKMRVHRVRRLPVIDPDGALVGLVASDDVLLDLGRRWEELGRVIEGGRRREVAPGESRGSSLYGKE